MYGIDFFSTEENLYPKLRQNFSELQLWEMDITLTTKWVDEFVELLDFGK